MERGAVVRSVRRALGPAAVGVLLGVGAFELFVRPLDTWVFAGSPWAHLPFLLATTVPLLWRRRAPVVVLAVVGLAAHAWAYLLFGPEVQAPIVPFLALLLAVFAAAERTDGRALAAAAAVTVAVVLADVPGLLLGRPPENTLPVWVFIGVAFAVGRIVHARATLLERVRATALELDREREARLDAAVAEERTRIARELHDVITHNVSLMVIQAAVEARRADGDDAEVFAGIETRGRETLVELRRLLGVLRRADEPHELAPQPTLTNLDALVEATERAGLRVVVERDGCLEGLPAGVDLTGYRIVQESLTNVRRHAHASSVRVELRRTQDRLEVLVQDDGRGDEGGGAGLGVVGMRERVRLHGGHLQVGDAEHGGYRVSASIPMDGAP